MKIGAAPVERVLSRIEKIPDAGCWIFMGSLCKGYGQVRCGSTTRRTHRIVYESLVGPIPEGRQLDHVCRVRSCCNPSHLRVVTNRENMMAPGSLALPRIYANATHCLHGHELSGTNLYLYRGKRQCRTCRHRRDQNKRGNK